MTLSYPVPFVLNVNGSVGVVVCSFFGDAYMHAGLRMHK